MKHQQTAMQTQTKRRLITKQRSLWFIALALSFVVILSGCTSKEVLNIYSWADNFDEQVLKDFEKEHNVKIRYDVFANNEELLAKLQTGRANYDLIQPSDYMVATMIQLDLLAPINKENIPNLANLSDNFDKVAYDPEGKYSIIYTWGVTGIAYNTKYIKDPITSWADLWKSDYARKVVLLDDSREVIGMALKKNGYSNSSLQDSELNKAAEDLKQLQANVIAYDTDNIKQKMISEEAWIGTVWSGDTALIHDENPDIQFVVPQEGGTIWADTIAIPKNSKRKELAEKFINYLLEPEVSARNYEEIGYSNPNEKALPFHSEEYRANTMINLSDEELQNTEWIVDVGEKLQTYDRIWTEIRSGR